jgi:hypothetical protein
VPKTFVTNYLQCAAEKLRMPETLSRRPVVPAITEMPSSGAFYPPNAGLRDTFEKTKIKKRREVFELSRLHPWH